ncbi:MAG: iron-containing alcohol dehydrogenase [Clostridia bacterium]|nr:iron-containing alcohol dehydrogenase [Clostridia bacterium]
MDAIRFHMPVQVIRREGALKEAGPIIRQAGKRCLIITGETSAARCGALDDALTALKEADVEATVFPLVKENPTMAICRQAASAAEAAGANSILAIGGGSVMDAAKAAAWITTNFVIDPDVVYSGKLRHPPLPLFVCGTTAGTGSEVSAVAVITDDSGKKRSIKSPFCYAKTAFCDSRYTDSMPRSVTVSTALDALCHAVEGYLNPACDAVSTLCAERAIPLIADGLFDLTEHDLPDRAGRDRLFDGALWAGMVLNACGTAFPHPMGYVLTEEHGVPHGMACAVFLPELLAVAKIAAPDRTAACFALAGGEERLTDILHTLVTAHIHMTEEQLEACAVRFADLPHFARVPGGYDGDRAAALCRRLFSF